MWLHVYEGWENIRPVETTQARDSPSDNKLIIHSKCKMQVMVNETRAKVSAAAAASDME